MDLPKFSLIYTSARPHLIADVVRRWKGRAARPADARFAIAVDDEAARAVAAGTAEDVVVNGGPKNCVAGWNAAAKLAERQGLGDVLIAVADDFDVPERWDDLLAGVAAPGWWLQDFAVRVYDGYNSDLCTLGIVTARRYRRRGYLFYPDYESIYCFPPDTPILMANHTLKPIGDVVPGDVVVGSVRRIGSRGTGKQRREFLQPSRVLEVHRKRDRLVRLTLKSGKVILCTPDHVWAYYGDTRVYLRNQAGTVLRGQGGHPRQKADGQLLYGTPRIGRRLVKVLDMPPSPPMDDQSVRELGWLAGIYDGEGCFPTITQSFDKNPEVCKELERVLTRLGFSFTVKGYRRKWRGKLIEQHGYCITGGRPEYLKFLSWVRPVRSFKRAVSKRMFTSRFGAPDEIVSIESYVDDKEVYCLSTETQNYVADGYLSHNSDTELTYSAAYEKRLISAPRLLFEHRHPDCGKRARDAVDEAHSSKGRWQRGEMLFKFRMSQNFPIDVEPPAELDRFALYMQAIRDDFCLYDVARRIVDEGRAGPAPVGRVYLMCPDEWWSGRPRSPAEMAEVQAAANRLCAEGVDAVLVDQRVGPARAFFRTRIDVETAMRNEALDRIYADGFAHVIIADGDEFWRRGFYARLAECVQTTAGVTAGLYTGMTPVVGYPGYPVEGSTDKATVYIAAPHHLVDCRTVAGSRAELPGHDVIHFTATRRTYEEVVQKHRESGHYDDPNYDFEGWIANTLPKIKPGFRNAHMYRHYQVWPLIRAWRPEELADLPACVLPYLGNGTAS